MYIICLLYMFVVGEILIYTLASGKYSYVTDDFEFMHFIPIFKDGISCIQHVK